MVLKYAPQNDILESLDHDAEADDIPLLFHELRDRYETDQIGEFQNLSENVSTEKDAHIAFENAIDNTIGAIASKTSCASCSKEVRVESVTSFERGQHISMPGQRFRKYSKCTHKLLHTYRHHAIIKEIKQTSGNRIKMELIHFNKEDDNYKICKSVDIFDLLYDELYIVEYIHPRYTADKIVIRAEAMLPKGNDGQHIFGTYSPGTNNCEHFATWCVVGKGESFQSQDLRTTVANIIQRMFGAGTKIAKMLMRILYISSDEIAASITSSFNVPEIVLGGTAALYLIYCIFMTFSYSKDSRNGHMCNTCWKGKLLDLWLTFAVFCATSLVTFVILNFALPLMTNPVGIPLIIVMVLLSVALQWSVPKIRNVLQSPFSVDKNNINKLSEIKIGDVISLIYYQIEHAVIVTEVHDTDSLKGRIRGVHYGLPNMFGTREVLEENFAIDLKDMTVKVFDCSHLLTFSPEMSVKLARKRVGEKKWAFTSNRSDHLCFWAKVKKGHRKVCENIQNNDIEVSSKRDLSSIFLEKMEVHLVNDLHLGDVIHYKERGILVGKVNLDIDKGRECKIEMIVYDWYWYCRKKTYIIDLKKDSIVIEHYHQAHCHPMAVITDRAKKLEDKKGRWWTNNGFINHCILFYPKSNKHYSK